MVLSKKNSMVTSSDTPTSPTSSSSNSKRPSSVSSDFDVSNYAIVFEEMMESKETRELFFQYLKLNRSVESLMFINEVDEYRSEYNKRFVQTPTDNHHHDNHHHHHNNNNNASTEKDGELLGEEERKRLHSNLMEMYNHAKNLLNKFVFQGGQFELNLPFALKEKLHTLWDVQVCACIQESTTLINDPSTRENHEGAKGDSNILSLVSLLETDRLFGDVVFSVSLDLRFDQFPRFSRSDMLLKFLTSKGERFTRAIATDISKGYHLDVRFKPHHLQDTTIDDNFIYFGFTLAEDTPDWDLTYSDKKNTCELYLSKTSYVFDTDALKGLRLGKIVTHVPFPIEEVWACFWNIQLHKTIDPMGGAETFKLLDYISPVSPQSGDSDGKPYYSNQQVSCCTKFPIPFMKKRDLPITMTAIRDPNIDMIMVAGHTCSLAEIREDCVPAQLMFYYMFYKVNENETRFIHTVYTDLKLPFNPDFMLKMIMSKRAKDYKKGFSQTIQRLRKESKREDGLMDTTKFIDDMKYNLSIQENAQLYPERSWFKEWTQLKSIRSITPLK